MMRATRYLAVLAAAGLLASCGGGKDDDIQLSGERISVMSLEQQLSVDPVAADIRVRLPQPVVNRDWPQAGGYANHAMYHLDLDEDLSVVWRSNVAAGSSGNRRLMAQPVVAGDRIYILDADMNVIAVDAEDGDRVWRKELPRTGEKRDSGFGGGIAYDDGKLFVTTGFGYLMSLDARDGRELWRVAGGVPFRGAPSIGGGQVFAVTHDNQLYAYDADTGEYLWYHVGIVENAGVLGAASPAVEDQTVVAAFSSGELFALRLENGRTNWTDALTRTGRLTPLSSINDIDGHPVIDRGRVYAVSHGNRMVSIDLRTGSRVWERNIAAVNTPWMGGDFLYVVTMDGELAALYRPDGGVKWLLPLQRYADPEDGKGLISWSGPILAGNRLIVVSSHGYVLSVSPFNGEVLDVAKAGSAVFVPPVVANKTLYILDDSGTLYALR